MGNEVPLSLRKSFLKCNYYLKNNNCNHFLCIFFIFHPQWRWVVHLNHEMRDVCLCFTPEINHEWLLELKSSKKTKTKQEVPKNPRTQQKMLMRLNVLLHIWWLRHMSNAADSACIDTVNWAFFVIWIGIVWLKAGLPTWPKWDGITTTTSWQIKLHTRQ